VNGTHWAGSFTNRTVLQKGADVQAAVYGVAFGHDDSVKVTVTVTNRDTDTQYV
jgi:hypothetical protein